MKNLLIITALLVVAYWFLRKKKPCGCGGAAAPAAGGGAAPVAADPAEALFDRNYAAPNGGDPTPVAQSSPTITTAPLQAVPAANTYGNTANLPSDSDLLNQYDQPTQVRPVADGDVNHMDALLLDPSTYTDVHSTANLNPLTGNLSAERYY